MSQGGGNNSNSSEIRMIPNTNSNIAEAEADDGPTAPLSGHPDPVDVSRQLVSPKNDLLARERDSRTAITCRNLGYQLSQCLR